MIGRVHPQSKDKTLERRMHCYYCVIGKKRLPCRDDGLLTPVSVESPYPGHLKNRAVDKNYRGHVTFPGNEAAVYVEAARL